MKTKSNSNYVSADYLLDNSWGPLVIADVVGGDLADNTVTLRIHGPMPHTILGAQWLLFHDAPPAAARVRTISSHDAEPIRSGGGVTPSADRTPGSP